MRPCRLHVAEVKQLQSLLNALVNDSELIDDLSLVQREQVKGTLETLRMLSPIVERREMEDAFNEG